MKTLIPLALVFLVSPLSQATVQTLPFTDAFTYPEGNLYTVATGVWDAGGNTGSEITVATAAALTAPAGFAHASGKGVRWAPGGTARRAVVQFTSVPNTDNNTVYVSFLVNVATPPSAAKLIAFLENSTSSTTSPQLGVFADNLSRIGIGKKATSAAAWSGSLSSGAHLVVVRYTFLASGNDQADLWVDPASTSYGASSPGGSLGSTSGSSDPSTLAYFQISTPSGAGPVLYLDEIRIATNWAGVTPMAGSLPPPAQPVVTEILLTANSVILRGTNGPALEGYAVLATGDLGLAQDQWTAIATNTFGPYGQFDSTNPASAENLQQFYRLRLLGALPPAPVPPAITNQPQDRTVAEGQNTTFSVGASGTAPLRYQWYFSPDTLLAGKTNAALALNSVLTNQSGGYFVVVTNVAGAVTSIVATLTVTSAPPTAPTITTQPQNQTVAEGQTATFSVVATGTPPLDYQWYFNTNTLLTDATNAVFQLGNAQSNHVGGYSVVITNSQGAVTSVVAALDVYPAPTNGTFYVATNGSDANPGTIDLPFLTVAKAVSLAGPGATIYLRGGTYFPTATIRITNSGTAGNVIRLWAYPGESPVIDFVNQPYGSANRGFLITTNGNYWDFKGLEIARAGDNGFKVEGSHHRFEQCVFHHNGDTGLQIGFGHDDANPGGLLAAFVEVVNCDSHLNYDSDNNGSDADGFAAKMHCGQGIVFTGCRAWENSDDGFDLFETDYGILITNCWTWRSGVGQGNGNGFKLGGNGSGGDSKGTHQAWNCVAFGHKVNGFTQNSHKDGLIVVNCLGYSNGSSGYNYFMEGSLNSGKQNVFKNNASIPRSGTNTGGFIEDNNPIQLNNSWNLAVTVNSADYADITETAAKAPRQPDGSLPTGFARLAAGSDLIDKGVDVGIPYSGTAPDLGPYEYTP